MFYKSLFLVLFFLTPFTANAIEDVDSSICAHLPVTYGAIDYIAFWAGTQVFLDNKNPYNSKNILQEELKIATGGTRVQYFLNPPWSLPIFSIFFNMSYEVSRILWIILSIFFCIGSIYLIKNIYDLKDFSLAHYILAFLFIPIHFNLMMGQLSLMVLFFLLSSYYFLLNKKNLLSGVLLVPCLVKPHIIFLYLLWLTIKVIREKRILFILASVITFLFLLACSEYMVPGIFNFWLDTDQTPFATKTASLSNFFRETVSVYFGRFEVWPIFLIPISAILLFLIHFFMCRKQKQGNIFLLIILSISLLASPYSWIHDFNLLLPLHVLLVYYVFNSSRSFFSRVFLIIFPQVLILLVCLLPFSIVQGDFFWFPMLFILYFMILIKSAFLGYEERILIRD